MWQRLPAFIREWSILIAGILLIVPFLYLSSYEASSSKSSASAPTLSQKDGAAGRPTAADAPIPSPELSSPPAPTRRKPRKFLRKRRRRHRLCRMTAWLPPRAPQTSGQGASAPKSAVAPVSGDVAAGKLVFRKCQACHSLEPGKNGLGPSLAGVIGKKAGGVSNYNYSTAMKGSNLTWDIATLDAYLSDPQKSVPGNKMPFPGLKTENERNAVIAYLAAGSSPAAAPLKHPTRQQSSERCPRQPISPRPVTFPGCVTRCAQGLPKAAWSLSASVARLMARSIRYCRQPKGRACRSP